MYAIIEESGSQRKVISGDEFLMDLLADAKAGQKISFDKVLVIGEIGGNAKFGQPYVAGAKVAAEVVEPSVQGEKVHIQKIQPKKGWQKKTGHRQRYTKVKVTGVTG